MGQCRPWTVGEQELLKSLHETKSKQQLARLLNRSECAVEKMADRLKIRLSNSKNLKATLCWECAKAVGGCKWSAEFLPVDGWDATPTIINQAYRPGQEVTAVGSYRVHRCPEFIYG